MIENVHNLSDEELVAHLKQGRLKAFDELVARYYKQIYRFMVRFIGKVDMAEDVTQEIFLKLYRSVELFDEKKRFKPWIFAVAANRGRDVLRSSGRAAKQITFESSDADHEISLVQVLAGNSETPETIVARQETSVRVREVLMQLPEQFREILIWPSKEAVI